MLGIMRNIFFILLPFFSGCAAPLTSINIENTVWAQNSGFGAFILSLKENRKAHLSIFSDTAPHSYEREGSYKIQGNDLSVVFPRTTVFSKPLIIGPFKIPSEKVKLEKFQAHFTIHGFFESGSKKYLDGYAKLLFIENKNNVIPVTD